MCSDIHDAKAYAHINASLQSSSVSFCSVCQRENRTHLETANLHACLKYRTCRLCLIFSLTVNLYINKKNLVWDYVSVLNEM